MDLLRSWILGLAGAALLTGAVIALTPKGKWTSVVTLVCGFMLLSVLLRPAVSLDAESISKAIVEYKADLHTYGEAVKTEEQRLTAEIIEKEAAEYIWDKAVEQGIELENIRVITRLENGPYPYPYAAEYTGSAADREKEKLEMIVEADLGIAKERQTWN